MNLYAKTVLGQTISAPIAYDPTILQPLVRDRCRGDALAAALQSSYQGWDDWFGYELSWCNAAGRPHMGCVHLRIPWNSRCLVESKSLKLYLNSLNFKCFESLSALKACLSHDISQAVEAPVEVKVWHWADRNQPASHSMPDDFQCIDDALDGYAEVDACMPDALTVSRDAICLQRYVSYLFRSNCPVTGQPDWASVWIELDGPCVSTQGLLRYLLSYRRHQGFHEQCIEQIFTDIIAQIQPHAVSVRGCFTRRGGVAIHPVRSMALSQR